MAAIAENLQAIRERLSRAGGVTLLAVSKAHGADAIREAAAAGQKAFGENYVQEAVEKMKVLPPLEWHMIGPLQSNKTRLAAERFDWVQTLSSEKIARRLSEQRPVNLPPLNVLVQVNVSGEASKSGVRPDEARSLAQTVASLPRLKIRGLMVIPEPGAPRERYRQAKELFESLKKELAIDTLSMGMSDDLDVALAEGATMVRIGTAIFGTRERASV